MKTPLFLNPSSGRSIICALHIAIDLSNVSGCHEASVTGAASTTIAVDAWIVAYMEFVRGQIANKRHKMEIHYHGVLVRICQIISERLLSP